MLGVKSEHKPITGKYAGKLMKIISKDMEKQEFIKECAMRNLSQCFSKFYPDSLNDNDVAKNCYEAAVKLADLIYKNTEE